MIIITKYVLNIPVLYKHPDGPAVDDITTCLTASLAGVYR